MQLPATVVTIAVCISLKVPLPDRLGGCLAVIRSLERLKKNLRVSAASTGEKIWAGAMVALAASRSWLTVH